MKTNLTIRDAREELARQLHALSGIGAIGVSWTDSGERCLRVNVEPGFTQRDKIPSNFHGITVTVQTSGIAQFSTTPTA